MLREESFSVLFCDVVALPERTARVDPFALVVDIEQPNAAVALGRLLENPDRRTVIAAIGTPETAERVNLPSAERARVFSRPLSIGDVIAFFRDIVRLDRRLAKLDPPSSAAGLGTGPGDSDSILVSGFPAIAGLAEVEDILPELDGSPISTRIAGTLSPEIEALLAGSARRLKEQRRLSEQEQAHSQPSVEPNVIVPPEMLALVDDLLAAEQSPVTRGGMDLAAMLSTPATGPPLPPPDPSSSHSILDSRPSWTGIPDPSASDMGSIPTGLVSDDERTGLRGDERSSDHPKTAIGLGEETNVPGGGTQVGHSSPIESGPLPPRATDTPSGSSPPAQTEHGTPRSELPSDQPPVRPTPYRPSEMPAVSAPPTPTEAFSLAADSALAAPSELAPMTTAGTPVFSSRHPAWRHSAAPQTALHDDGATRAAIDSHEFTRGDPIEMMAGAVAHRMTGALLLTSVDGQVVRRILLRDGDMVNAASEHDSDALVSFLIERGDLGPEVSQMRSARLPHTGRHAAAALIANGFLGQDDLWPVLRAHAEWIIGRALSDSPALGRLEREPPERLRAEPNVFGGAAGVEVFIDTVRRVLSGENALARLGGPEAVLGEGPRTPLLAESALTNDELDNVRAVTGRPLAHVLERPSNGFEAVAYALVALGILTARAPSRRPELAATPEVDPLDADAVRKRVHARMALVHEADYFSLLGVTSAATGYEIRRAFVELRRTFEPSRLLTAATSDLHEDVVVIVEVLEEAYQILRDPHRRTRYRRALEAVGP